MKTYIIGHTKPDTDAVVSTLALVYLYNHADCYGYQDPIPVITDPLNPETQYLFEKFSIAPPTLIKPEDLASDDQIILVDHNEPSQRAHGVTSSQIVEIIDHHKINLNLDQPIFATFKAWGSTCTIIFHLMKENSLVPDQTLASLMLAAVLSDTVGFKSATTTQKDRDVGEELVKIAQIADLDAFTLEILKAKSDVSKLTDLEIVKNDYKIFDFGKSVLIDQLETVEQEYILTHKKASLLKAMEQVKKDEGVDAIFVAVSDILNVNTKLIILSEVEEGIALKAFGGTVIDHVLDIGPKLSRKKEIAPPIERACRD
jgi:manganese-dependent inorganic pyrophosphatase